MVDADRFDELYTVEMNLATEIESEVWVKGEEHPRVVKYANGKMEIGGGAAPPDVSIERSAAGVMSMTGGIRNNIVNLSASTNLDAQTHANRTLVLTGTGAARTQTLPAATGTGDRYFFIVGAVNTSNHVITALSGDLLCGNIITNSTGDTPDLAQPWPADQSNDIIITLNGTTTGGQAIGDWVELIDIATDKWFVRGVTTSSGMEATPFS